MDFLSLCPSHALTSFPSHSDTRSRLSRSPFPSSLTPQCFVPFRSPSNSSPASLTCSFTPAPEPSENQPFISRIEVPEGLDFEEDLMGQLLMKERVVFLGSSIDDHLANAVMSQLIVLDGQDPTKDITLFINSPGGSLSATLAIYDVIQFVRADVSTVAFGIAASAASIILGGGTKGKRFAMPHARIMIHQSLGELSEQAIDDVEIQAKEVMKNRNIVTRIISGFTGRSFEQVLEDIGRNIYMSSIEAVEYGIIDAVIDRDILV